MIASDVRTRKRFKALNRRIFHLLATLPVGLIATGISATAAFASPGPQPLPMPPAIPGPQDTPFPGTIHLSVDATDLARHIMTTHETIPVPAEIAAKGGDMTLLYPMWVPGDHAPTGKIDQFGGFVVHAGGKVIPWLRDTVEVSAFHINVPKGTHALDLDFQFLSPVSPEEGRVVITPSMLNVQWNLVSLYPAGYFTRQINIVTQLKLPAQWKYGTALRAETTGTGNEITFRPVTYNTLVDSPLYAGQYFRKIDLAPGSSVPVALNIVADHPDELDATDDQIAAHRALVAQANLLFGAHHYDHYDFLLALTKELGGIGLEHHQSSENSAPCGYFTEWEKTFAANDLLAHEYTHSWNGKFRRPDGLWAPNFNVAQRGTQLWVYEGQTQYWGYVLAARSGLLTHAQTIDAIAVVAASYDAARGRTWRPLIDTTNDPVIAQRAPQSWRSWQRSEDYYSEGQLIWLDADTLIRSKTGGQKSLNDFARHFFGVNDGSFVPVTYSFDDIVHNLNDIMPYDWATFLRDRLDKVTQHAPLDGITRGGYKLVFNDTPNAWLKSYAYVRHVSDFAYSLGLTVKKDGTISGVLWGSPAWTESLTRDEKIVAVNGESYDDDALSAAIKDAAHDHSARIALLVQSGSHYRTVKIDYHGGIRIPHLERVGGTPDLLGDILTPLR